MRTVLIFLLLASGMVVADEASDRALAERIRTLTNRSADGLTDRAQPNGGLSIDLRERFQHAYLAQLGPDGELNATCVGSIDEANAFFGRDLETGAAVQRIHDQPKSSLAKSATAHGMTTLLYQRYLSMIEQSKSMLAPNASTFSVINNDAAGEGFNDPSARTAEGGNTGTTLGQQRLNVFNQAGAIWGGFVDSSVTIQVRGNFDPLTPCSSTGGVLGSAGPLNVFRDFTNAPFVNTFYPGALANKLAGADQNAAEPDIGATFNSSVDTACLGAGTRFYYGLDNATPAGTINLLIVVLHEIGHGMGSLTFTDATNGTFLGGSPDIWARFMRDRNVGLPWLTMNAAQRVTSAITPNNLFWDGASVRIASGFLSAGAEAGTGRVELFTPSVLQGGSSVSHWGTVATPNLLMEPSISVGLPLTLDLTRQQMRDIGWYRDTTSDLVRDEITTVTPNSGSVTAGGSSTISWTNTGGFNRNVTIELSTDGGTNFGTVIASDVSNTGSFNWSVPNISAPLARIRVREHNFAEPVGISSANFSIGGGAPVLQQPQAQVLTGNNLIEPNECNQLNVSLSNTGTATASAVTATLSTSTPNVTITQATATYADIAAGGTGTNLTPFQISSSNTLVCLSNISLNLNVTYTGGGSPAALSFNLPVGQAGVTSNYAFASGSNTIPTGGVLLTGSQGDDVTAALIVPAGFSFTLFGNSILGGSAATVSSNGNLQFAATGTNAYANSALPITTTAGTGVTGVFPPSAPTLFPYWDDLNMTGAGRGVFTNLIGTAPNRTWVVEWRGITFTGSLAVNFAIVFSEGSNDFQYRYNNATTANGSGATIGVQAASSGTAFTQFSLNAAVVTSGLQLSASQASIPAICSSGDGICSSVVDPRRGFAVGSVTLPATGAGANNATRVRLPQIFDTAPVVIVQLDSANADPQALRVTNVTSTGFDLLQVEAPGLGCAGCTGAGPAVVAHWLAARPGVYRLQDDVAAMPGIDRSVRAPGPGVLIKVGTVSLSNSQRATSFVGGFTGWASPSWNSVLFTSLVGSDFAAPPVLLSTIQTWNSANEGADLVLMPVPALTGASEVWLTPAIRSVTDLGFDAALESSSVDDNGSASVGIVGSETLGYVAIQAGASSRLIASGGSLVGLISVLSTGGFGTCANLIGNFPAGTPTNATNLRGFGGLASRNEDDGGWLRRCALASSGGTNAQVGLRIDEDADLSNDRTHTTSETVGAAVFGGDFTTTPVTLARVSSARVGAQLEVSFSAATEVGHLGYRIWGRASVREDWRALHPDLILNAEGDQFTARSYRQLLDASAVSEIRIEDVDLLGQSRFHPAVAVGETIGAEPVTQPLDWSAIRASHAQRAIPRSADPTQYGVLAEVIKSGVQRVAVSELLAQGMNLTQADLARLAVLDAETPVARVLECPSFPTQCEIEWLGHARESLYGSGNVYTLKLDASAVRNAGTGALHLLANASPRVYDAVIEQAPNRAYSFSAPGNDPWFDQRLVASSAPVQLTRNFTLSERAPGPVRLSMRLWGGVDFPGDADDHSIELLLNGTRVAERRFNGLREERIDLELPDTLLSSSNTLTLRVRADTGFSADIVMLDGYTLSYPRYSRNPGERLRFGEFVSGQAAGNGELLFKQGFEAEGRFALTGAAGSVVWSVLENRILRDRVLGDAALDSQTSALWLDAENNIARPTVRATALAARAKPVDYLIVSHPLFIDELQPLVELQQRRGYSVAVVRSDEILARGDHALDPQPLRDFIAEVNPRFVLLVGGDSYDYANNLGLGSMSFIPAFYRVADPIVRFAATDHPYVDANNDGIPERAIGRIPARTVEEFKRASTSILERSQLPAERFLAAAGGSSVNEAFDTSSRALLSHLRQGQPVSYALVDELGLVEARSRTTAALAGAADWINYLGHSSPNRWSFQNLLDTSQLASISRQGAPAIVSQWGCWNNNFVLPNQDTMAHALMLRSNRLSAAVIGSSSLAEDASHLALGTRFFDLVEDGHFDNTPMDVRTLGEALLVAKSALLQSAPEHANSVYSITLFGDPAMPLR